MQPRDFDLFRALLSTSPIRHGLNEACLRPVAHTAAGPRPYFGWVNCIPDSNWEQLLFRPEQHRLANAEKQEEAGPGGEERRVGAEITHRKCEIVGDEIGKAERHADHDT